MRTRPHLIGAASSAVAVAAALSLLAGGCGTQTAVDATPEAVDDTRAIETLADTTLAQIAGTATQREAEHYVVFKELNSAYETCMNDQGIDFTAEYHTLFAGYRPNGTSGVWMGALNRKPSETALANAAAYRDDMRGQLPADERSAAFVAAQAKCDATTSDSADQQVVLGEPGGVDLEAEFTTMLTGVEEKLGDIAPYTTCMQKAGIDYTTKSDGEQGWAGLYLYLTAQMPTPPLSAEASDTTWQAYLDLERRALAADATCRAAKYAEGLALLAPRIVTFRERYASQLQASQASWTSKLKNAQALGFKTS